MDNKTFAAAMRQEAERFEDIVLVTKEQFLRIADRIEASEDPKGTAPFCGVVLNESYGSETEKC